jgi:hypothetical protein
MVLGLDLVSGGLFRWIKINLGVSEAKVDQHAAFDVRFRALLQHNIGK